MSTPDISHVSRSGASRRAGSNRSRQARSNRRPNLCRHTRPILRLGLLATAILAVLVSVAACGSTVPTPSPTAQPSATPTGTPQPSASATPSVSVGPTANPSADLAVYTEIEAQVQQLRQLTANDPVHPVLLDEQGVKSWMTKAYQTQIDHVALASQSRLLVHLGLLPAGASLEQMELDLNSGQAIGFYDPTSKGLYLLSQGGTVGAVQKLTFSHEFTHALQDQNFGLDKLDTDAVDQTDRDLARTALAEGDATLAMTQWSQSYMSIGDLLAASLDSASAEQQRQLDAAPSILREELEFPYFSGLTFVQSAYQSGGWAAVDRLYSNPPSSTSQILHPELYRAGVQPVKLSVPGVPAILGKGWKLSFQDTMGELQLGIWLAGDKATSAQSSAAVSAVSTWGGDRIGLYEGPSDSWAVVLQTQWRNAGGAAAFNAAATAKLEGVASTPSMVCASGNKVAVILASDTTALGAFATCKPGE